MNGTDTVSVPSEDLTSLKQAYLDTVTKTRSKFAKDASNARIMAIVGEHECEILVCHLLADGSGAKRKIFDRWWSEKHDDLRRRLVERLKNHFEDLGLKCSVATEAETATGYADVAIENGFGNIVRILDERRGKRIVVEIKTGLGTSIKQLVRYLLECDALILVRLKTSHVIALRSSDLEQFLCEDIRDLLRKMRRILENRPILVRGNSCSGCLARCRFATETRIQQNSEKLIALRNDDFAKDFEYTLCNAYDTIGRAITLVSEELKLSEAARPDDIVRLSVRRPFDKNTKTGSHTVNEA
jgi:hypothetical protein